MRIFDIFRSKIPYLSPVMVKNNTVSESNVQNNSSDDSDRDNSSESKTTIKMENNIEENQIYSTKSKAQEDFEDYVRQDFEEKGRQDGLTNPELGHLKNGIESLRSDMLSMANTADFEVRSILFKIEAWIEMNIRFGNMDTVRRLKSEKDILESKLKRTEMFVKGIAFEDVIEVQTSDNLNSVEIKDTGECRKVLLSYSRGFKKGVAALTFISFIKK